MAESPSAAKDYFIQNGFFHQKEDFIRENVFKKDFFHGFANFSISENIQKFTLFRKVLLPLNEKYSGLDFSLRTKSKMHSEIQLPLPKEYSQFSLKPLFEEELSIVFFSIIASDTTNKNTCCLDIVTRKNNPKRCVT